MAQATTLQAPTIDQLRERVRGPILTPQDDSYEAARKVHNGMIDRRPAVIVRCMDTGDVVAAIECARENGLDLSVRGGSHSVPGFGTNDGGVVIDLSLLRWVRVDARNRTARAGGGCTWGDFNHATHAYGLATTGGVVSTTGIAGLTLGGGIGYLARACGLSLDNLISADVVTADGRCLVASEKENADLFWAIRGGGGNFGVVTAFEFKLHPVQDVFVGLFFYPLEHARTVLETFDAFIDKAPEEVGGFPAFHIAPPLPFVPEGEVGKPFSVVVATWAGAIDKGEKAIAPLRNAAPRAAELVTPMPYPMLNSLFDPLLPPGLQHYWKTSYAADLTDGAIRAHLEFGPKVPAVNTAVHLYPLNGACQRVRPNATAFAYRNAKYAAVIAGMWPDPADNEKNIAWVKDYYRALEPHSLKGGYVNFMAGDDQERVQDSYAGNYDRLVSIKRTYDPGNLFHMNQNIRP